MYLRKKENGYTFEYIVNHFCSCGHEQRDHMIDIVESKNGSCNIDDCNCIGFFP